MSHFFFEAVNNIMEMYTFSIIKYRYERRDTMGKVKSDFLWGTACAAYQCEGGWNEGGKGESNWDQFCHSSKNTKGVTGDVASDFYHRYKEDIRLLKEAGHNTLRFSLSWTRILPDKDKRVNEEGIAFYKDVLKECKENGIVPNVTLLHYDIPAWLEDIGGYANPLFSDEFAYYAKVVFENFGNEIPLYVTINESTHNAYCSYLTGNYPPNVHNVQMLVQVCYNLVIANAKAIHEFRKLNIKSQVGIVHTTNTVQILQDTPAYRVAQRRGDLFKNKWVTDPAILGKFPDDLFPLLKESGINLGFVLEEDLELLKDNTIDFLGQNCYTRALVKPYESGETNYYPNNVGAGAKAIEGYIVKGWFQTDVDPTTPKNMWSREIYPKTIYDMLLGIKKDYGDIPVYITENGHALYEEITEDGKVVDQERIAFMKSYLEWLIKAENEGCNVKGYYAWSTTDCYSWINGYEKRYGLIYIDYENGLNRIPKESYYWYANFIKEHTEKK